MARFIRAIHDFSAESTVFFRITGWIRNLCTRSSKRAAVQARYKLEDLLEGMTPEAMQDAFEWDKDIAREIVG